GFDGQTEGLHFFGVDGLSTGLAMAVHDPVFSITDGGGGVDEQRDRLGGADLVSLPVLVEQADVGDEVDPGGWCPVRVVLSIQFGQSSWSDALGILGEG